MRTATHSIVNGMAACAALVLTSCSSGDYGDEEEPAPRAVASALGQPFTTDTSGNLQTTVRAGADVVLSGKDSSKGPDDTGVPLIRFLWEQVTPGSTPVNIVYRTSNTISFTAPQVTQDTTLRFRLTVSDARGNAAATDANVLVKPVRDADRFLQFIGAAGTFPVVLATANDIAGVPGADATATLPATVTLTKLVTFTDRTGITRTRIPVGQPVRVDASWATRVGTRAACAANENPTVRLPIPRIDLDDRLVTPLAAYPDATLLSDVMEAADVDGITLEVRIDVGWSSAAMTAPTPRACIAGGATSVASGEIRTTESLYAANAPRDSKTAAAAYYAAIDPTNSKTTLTTWMANNANTPGLIGFNPDTHAVYTNNFDLGFGRDMYMKFGACDAGAAALPLGQRAGRCDVAAVVINYADVEGAVKRINPIVAVAMEYSAAPGTGARFVKFYTFTPDTRTGEYRRVLSVNLDRRGEQYMPQTCVVCHGGTPQSPQNYAANADVGATFLPWDLDSFLYSDTDPGFSHKSRDAALKAQFTRARQEAQFKRLNEGAYLTYNPNHPVAGRFALPRELLEKWYGGVNLPTATFDDSAVPAGWAPGGANNNPVGSDTIYRDVFARYCRSCHVMQVPANGDPRTAMLQPAGVAQPLAACSSDTRLFNTSVGIPSQVPMGCYWELAHAPNLGRQLSGAQMPFARRTMDRLWGIHGAGTTVGQAVQTHLQTAQNITVATPGTPSACIDPFGTPILGQSASEVLRNDWTALDSSCSRFLSNRTWTLTAPVGSAAALVGLDTATPRFMADRQGDYTLTLADAGGTPTVSAVARVTTVAPIAGNGTTNVVLNASGTATADVNVMALPGSQSRDPLSALQILTQSGVTASVLSVTATTAVVRINVSSLAGGSVTYRLTDTDLDQSGVGTVTVNVSASIAANNSTINVATNGAQVVNLSGLVSSASQPFTLSIFTSPSASNGRGTGGVTSPSGGNTTYTAPLGTTSHFGGTLISSGSIDSFVYRACFTAQPAVCDNGTITVNLVGSQSSTSVLQTMSTNCSGCHQSAQASANPNYLIDFITNGTTLAPYDTVAERQDFYCMLRTLVPSGEPGFSFVNITSPASSLIYRKPQNLNSHGGGLVASDTNQPPLITIFNWINQGAYFTESTAQACN